MTKQEIRKEIRELIRQIRFHRGVDQHIMEQFYRDILTETLIEYDELKVGE